VIVPQADLAELWSLFPRAIVELKALIGAKELHFADIYVGRPEFKNLPGEMRLASFRFMAYVSKAMAALPSYRLWILIRWIACARKENFRNA
jgi:hypothetical protein